MSDEDVPAEVRGFLFAHVHTHEQLEALQLMVRRNGQQCTPDTVAHELGIPLPAATAALEHLCAHNLLDVRIGGNLLFRYSPADRLLGGAVENLVLTYASRRIQLLALLGIHAAEHERSSELKIFADAFRLKGSQKDG